VRIGQIVGQLHRALEQPRVQVEDVARVRLATWRAPEQQRHLAIGVRVLRQVVIDHQRGLAVVQEVLAHGAPRVGRQELDRGGFVGRGHHDDRVL
jgi:hypothetical protein